MVDVRELTPDDAPACDAILLTLPTFFGHEGGRRQAAHDVRTQQGAVAVEDGEVVGFITIAPSTGETLEITWMAVRNDRRRRGIGRRLIETIAASAGRPLAVMTAGPSSPEPDADPNDNYEGTRVFYREMGFIPVKELTPEGWNQPSLVLARPVSQMPDYPDTVLAIVIVDCYDPERLAAFWGEFLGREVTHREEGYVGLEWAPRFGAGMVFQKVGEPKAGKNRVHPDIICPDLEATAKRVEALGGSRAERQPESRFMVMADPEGNEFCLTRFGG